ncbi:7004_t:CDS:2, partial [Funneliformis geosporum]
MVDSIKEHNDLNIGSINAQIDDDPSYLAISPNGELIATFDSKTYDLKVYDLEINKEVVKLESRENDNQISNTPFFTIDKMKINPLHTRVSFSLAISNYAKIGKKLVAFVALSSFCDKDMKKVCENKDDVSDKNPRNTQDLEKGEPNPETFIFSTKSNESIKTSVKNRGGVVRFLNNNLPKGADQSGGSTNLILMNTSGITKVFIRHKYNKRIFDEYEFPTMIQVKIDKLYQELPCTRFLNSVVEKNYLFVEDYKNQKLEMYNLQSMDLELRFHEISLPKKASGNPIFSISKHGHLLAYYSGANCISIHLMENGLKVATKEFTDVLSISFINNDERLLVVTEKDSEKATKDVEKVTEEIIKDYTFIPTFNIWDLFTFKNDVHKVNHLSIFSSLQKSSIVCSSGIILANLPDKVVRLDPLITINQAQNNSSKTDDFKVIKTFNVKKEPWVHKQPNFSYFYLDKEKTIKLIIGETTVQVWKKTSHNDNTKIKKFLEYIWINPKKFTAASLKNDVIKREFYLELSWSDNEKPDKYIHWPNEVHALKDACIAMEYLYKRRDEPVGTRNLTKYKDLVAYTECLIKTCIKKNPDLWSLSEVRFDVMANIIRSKSVPLLHHTLFDYKQADGNKQDKTRVSRYLHIPREFEWPMRTKSMSAKTKESDLMLAIKITSSGHHKVIVAMLLEYYSNNAEKDT